MITDFKSIEDFHYYLPNCPICKRKTKFSISNFNNGYKDDVFTARNYNNSISILDAVNPSKKLFSVNISNNSIKRYGKRDFSYISKLTASINCPLYHFLFDGKFCIKDNAEHFDNILFKSYTFIINTKSVNITMNGNEDITNLLITMDGISRKVQQKFLIFDFNDRKQFFKQIDRIMLLM